MISEPFGCDALKNNRISSTEELMHRALHAARKLAFIVQNRADLASCFIGGADQFH